MPELINLALLADKLAPLFAERFGLEIHRTERKAANEPDDWPKEPDEADPWASDEPRQENRSSGRSERPRGNSGGSRPSGNRQGGSSTGRTSSSGGSSRGRSSGGSRGGSSDIPESGQHEDRIGKLWEFGLDDAPMCYGNRQHDPMPAAEVTKPRAQWRAWACPLGFGKNYKDKCDMWEYQD